MEILTLRRSRQVTGLVWLALVASVVGSIAATTFAGRLGHPAFVINGSSMEPGIPLGSVVLTRPADASRLVPGDVISVMSASGTVFTHRITAIEANGTERLFQLRGDANAAVDPRLVPAPSIIGQVVLHLPMIGYLLALFSLPTGMIGLVTGLASLLLLFWLLEDLERCSVPPTDGCAVGTPGPVGA